MRQAPSSQPTPTGIKGTLQSEIHCPYNFRLPVFQKPDPSAGNGQLPLSTIRVRVPVMVLLEHVVPDHPPKGTADQHIRRKVLLAEHPGHAPPRCPPKKS